MRSLESNHALSKCLPLTLCAIALVTSSACGVDKDPLARDRARLLKEARAPLPKDWPAEATVLIGQPLLKSQLEVALQGALDDARPLMSLKGEMGAIDLNPTLAVEGLTFRTSPVCKGCVEVTAILVGEVGAKIGGSIFGGVELAAPYRGSATATVEVAILIPALSIGSRALGTGPQQVRFPSEAARPKSRPNEVGSPRVDDDRSRKIAVIPREGSWRIKLELKGLPAAVSREAETVVQNALQNAVREKKLQAIEVARLPQNDVVDVKGIRVRADNSGLAVDFAFATLKRGRAQTPNGASEGWVASIPEGTLLGLAHAAALRAGPQNGWAPEPVAFEVDDDKFKLTLKMWRVKPTPDFRTIEVIGTVRVTSEGLVDVKSDEVREVGEKGGFTLDPVVLVTRAILLEEIRKALSAVVPSETSKSIGAAGVVTVRLKRALLDDGAIQLFGSLEVHPDDEPHADDAPGRS